MRGVEPRLLHCKCSVLPLSLHPHLVAEEGIEPVLVVAYETTVCTSSSSPQNYLVRNGVIETPSVSNRLTVLPLDESRMEPSPGVEPGYLNYKSSASPSMLARQKVMEPKERIKLSFFPYQRNVLSLNYIGWSFAADLNRAFLITKQVCRHLHLRSMERSPGVQPGWLVWKTRA